MDQPVQDDGSPSGLQEADQRVLPATPPECAEATPHEWTVTNEVCSLLDDVSEATIRMKEAGDTHVSQVMFIMVEVIAMLKEESHPIRVSNATVLPPPPDGIPTKSTQVAELALEAQDVREVLLEVMEDKGVGKASLKVERLCALLDPRWKALDADQLVNGYAALRTRAEENLKGVIAEFADAQRQSSAPVPAPVLDVEPAEPAPKKKRFSTLEERREARVRAAAGGGGDSDSAEPQAAVTGRRVLIGREALVYLAEQGQLDGCFQPSEVLKSVEHRQRMPDDEHCHVFGGNVVSGVYRSLPWD